MLLILSSTSISYTPELSLSNSGVSSPTLLVKESNLAIGFTSLLTVIL